MVSPGMPPSRLELNRAPVEYFVSSLSRQRSYHEPQSCIHTRHRGRRTILYGRTLPAICVLRGVEPLAAHQDTIAAQNSDHEITNLPELLDSINSIDRAPVSLRRRFPLEWSPTMMSACVLPNSRERSIPMPRIKQLLREGKVVRCFGFGQLLDSQAGGDPG